MVGGGARFGLWNRSPARALRLRGAVNAQAVDDGPSSETLGLVSVIISNYNYAEFVAQAIGSALALDWRELEVIVVDDGSTDGSLEVIERYADRVQVVAQPNGGQISAYNTGFARSRGNVVIFLDSDDVLEPSLLRELSRVWRAGVSKAQFQMRVIDGRGSATGAFLPQFRIVPTSRDVRRWVERCGTYPTPPGSANAYARSFLEKIFPLVGEDRAADAYCLAAAPHFGDVVTIAKPLVGYRVHGRNQGAMVELDARRFGREVERARFCVRFARSLPGARALPAGEQVLGRSLHTLPYRLASLKLLPREHPLCGDSVTRILRDWLLASVTPQGVSLSATGALLAWAVLVAMAPAEWAAPLVLWRFVPSSRPSALTRALGALKVLKAPVAHV